MTKTESERPLRRLLQYARGYRNRIVLATSFSILNKLFDLAPPALIGLGIDIVVEQDQSFLARFGFEDAFTQLWILALLTFAVWGLESLFQYIYALLWRNLAQAVQHDLRMDGYDHVQTLDMEYFEDQSTGNLMAILNDDINQLERFLDTGANDLIQVTTTVIAIGATFMYLAPSVAWMALAPMPFIIWGSVHFQKMLEPRYAAVREQAGFINALLGNNLSGIATIKSFTAEQHEIGRLEKESVLYRERNRSAIRLSAAFSPLIRMIIVVGFIGMTVFGGKLALDGALRVSSYTVMVYLTQRLLWPLTRLGEMFDLYQRAMASTNRIFNLLDVDSTINDGAQRLTVADVQGDILFERVSFHYNQRQTTLNDLSFKVDAGETVAIVGATGAGKSTVVKLLLRFYDVKTGRITIDGHDIRDLNLGDLRRSIGLVSQDVYLFHGSVYENIVYGSFGATENEAQAAAKIAEAHEFIMSLPEGYDTIVGERGQKLSGGQRQRLSIARAVLKNPPILILDEATSAVDNETEAAIQRSLERIVVDRTTIMIAHRLSTVRNADCIYVLENGVLREEGRHETLLDMDGIYAALWKVQTGERAQ